MIYVLNSANGVFIPQQTWNMYKDNPHWDWSELSTDDQRSLENGPEDEFYWEAWENALALVRVKDDSGRIYYLLHDQDLFLIKPDEEEL